MGRIGEDLWKKNVRKMPKSNISGQKTRRVYRYRLSYIGTGMQWVTCTGTG